MIWTVEVTEEFEAWWNRLGDDERESVDGMIRVLEAHGPALGSPYSVEVPGSAHTALRQLLVPHQQRMFCVLFAPDQPRSALMLLTGATQTADGRCPPESAAAADHILSAYLARRGQH